MMMKKMVMLIMLIIKLLVMVLVYPAWKGFLNRHFQGISIEHPCKIFDGKIPNRLAFDRFSSLKDEHDLAKVSLGLESFVSVKKGNTKKTSAKQGYVNGDYDNIYDDDDDDDDDDYGDSDVMIMMMINVLCLVIYKTNIEIQRKRQTN